MRRRRAQPAHDASMQAYAQRLAAESELLRVRQRQQGVSEQLELLEEDLMRP